MTCEIHREGVVYQAAKCEACGVKIWPIEGMKLHKLIHEVKADRHEVSKAENRRNFTKMRNKW